MSEPSKASFIKKRKHARDKAMQALYQWQISGETLDWIRDHYLEEQGVSSGDEAYFLDLLYQIPDQAERLDASFMPLAKNFDDHMDPIERSILLIASYELSERPEIPVKVIINEAIKLAKSYGSDDSHKFINGVLDPLARQLRQMEMAALSD